MKTWECTKTLEGHSNSVLCLEILNSAEFISASLDKNLRIWNIYTGKCVKTLNCREYFICCLKLTSNNEIISGSYREIKIWLTTNWTVVNKFIMHNSFIRCIEIIPVTGEVITCGENDSVKIWDKNKGF